MRHAALRWILFVLVCAILGCGRPVLGFDERAVTYEVDARWVERSLARDHDAARLALAMEDAIRTRLAVARLRADVRVADDASTVRVVSVAAAVPSIEFTLSDSNGVRVWRLAADRPLVGGEDLQHGTASLPDGAPDAWWDGPFARIRAADPPAESIFVVEPLDASRGRLRIADAKPLTTLWSSDVQRLEELNDGRALRLVLADGAIRRIHALTGADGGLHGYALGLGSDVLRVADAFALERPIVLSFGDDLRAYESARHVAGLIVFDGPPLRAVSMAALPNRAWLPVVTIVVALVLSAAWLAFVRRFDRSYPEPWWLLCATFALGALFGFLGQRFELVVFGLRDWLNPMLAARAGHLSGFPGSLALTTLVVGVVEEGVKLLAVVVLAARRRDFDEPVDGVIYACAAAIGFAAYENVDYFMADRLAYGEVTLRAIQCIGGHLFFSSLWGYGLGARLVDRRRGMRLLVLLFAASVFAHGLYDAICSSTPLGFLAPWITVILGALFVTLVRRALRHGRVSAGAVPRVSGAKGSFVVGARGASLAWTAVMLGAAWTMVSASRALDRSGSHGALVVLVVAVAVFALAAHRFATTTPLDVLLDDDALTFAGRSTAWNEIVALEVARAGWRHRVVVHTLDGDLHVGPTTEERARAMARAIDERLCSTAPAPARSAHAR